MCKLKVCDIQSRLDITHLRVRGKSGKLRFVPAHPTALARISDCLEAAGHGAGSKLRKALWQQFSSPDRRTGLA